MINFICEQCGVQFAAASEPPERCPICEDEREFVNWAGQRWTTLEGLRATHRNALSFEGSGVLGIGTEPSFAIGQRALLVRAADGNVLWDCITLIDETTIEAVQALGGVSAIAISHPHFYSAMVEWSDAFGDVPIYLHAADRKWVMRPDPKIIFWEGDTQAIGEGLTLIRCGVHFEGGTVLHWAGGEEGNGALFSGDIFHVVPDRRYVSFMYSYPNFIPERPDVVEQAVKAVEPFRFERIYGGWWGHVVHSSGKDAIARSAERYLRAVRRRRVR